MIGNAVAQQATHARIGSLKQLQALLDALGDPKAVKAEVDKIQKARDEAEAAAAKLNDAYKKADTLKQAEEILERAQEADAKARALLKQAETQAQSVVAKAKAEVEESANKTRVVLENVSNQLEEREKKVQAREDAVGRREQIAEEKLSEAHSIAAEARDTRNRFQEKMEQLQAVVDS